MGQACARGATTRPARRSEFGKPWNAGPNRFRRLSVQQDRRKPEGQRRNRVDDFASPNRFLIEISLLLAMTIFDDPGSLTAPIIGAILLVVMWKILGDVSPYAHMLLFATLVIVVMVFFRAGIFGLIATRRKAGR